MMEPPAGAPSPSVCPPPPPPEAPRGGTECNSPLQLHPGAALRPAGVFGILRARSSHPEGESLIGGGGVIAAAARDHVSPESRNQQPPLTARVAVGSPSAPERHGRDGGSDGGAVREVTSLLSSSSSSSSLPASISAVGSQTTDSDANAAAGNNRDPSYQRYDIQQVERWIDQILPFSLLLLVVFIRQHLQGFFVTIWIAAVMFKSNDILRKQTALKVYDIPI
uniref:Uncharacterized protein n=1 Tax=Ananas comosus var. bracteatus TaxID=296719 RepID=A0A6V7QAL6_ANACO|nr:unnamed protein product [Ananas comosus var. bracteatus]